jgi:hypothetical protein
MAHTVGWDGKKDEKGRKLLQDLGLVVRDYDPNYWIDSLMVEMWTNGPPSGNFYVDDLRFKNEAAALRREGFVLVRINPCVQEWENYYDEHPSEVDLMQHPHDHCITSTRGDIQGMLKQVDDIVEGLGA